MIDLCDDLLLAPEARVRDLLDRQALKTWVDRQRQTQAFSVYQAWTMLVLELWLRSIEEPAPPQIEVVLSPRPAGASR